MSTRFPGARVSARGARQAPGQIGFARAPTTPLDYPCESCWADRDEPCATGVTCAGRAPSASERSGEA